TLVENAVKHGIARLRTPGHIRIVATREGGRVCLEVRDTGPGPEDGTPQQRPPSGEGFGLRSVRDRLAGHFGTEASFALVREDEATVARVVMPVFVERAVVSGAGR